MNKTKTSIKLAAAIFCFSFALPLAAKAASGAAPAWEFHAGGELWSPLREKDGVIYFGSDDKKIYALDARTHRPRWAVKTGGSVRSAAAFDDRAVLLASDDGKLYSLDRADGKILWTFDLGDANIERKNASFDKTNWDYLKSSPVLADGVVYIGSGDGHVYAIDAKSGVLRWKTATGERVRATPLVHDGRVYIGSWDKNFYCLNAADGAIVWKYRTEGEIQSSATYANGLIVFGGRDPALFALDQSSGELRWKHRYSDGSWVESTAVLADGTLYVGSSDSNKVSAFDPATGKESWSAATGGWSWATPLIDHGVIYIGALGAPSYKSSDKHLTAPGFFAFEAASGKMLWRRPTDNKKKLLNGYVDGGVFAQPVVVDGNVVVPEVRGTLKAVPLRKLIKSCVPTECR
jgi:eukaryotic-like serine/threonine-protein kinase